MLGSPSPYESSSGIISGLEFAPDFEPDERGGGDKPTSGRVLGNIGESLDYEQWDYPCVASVEVSRTVSAFDCDLYSTSPV